MSPGTEFARDFCAGIGPLQLGVVLVFYFFNFFVGVIPLFHFFLNFWLYFKAASKLVMNSNTAYHSTLYLDSHKAKIIYQYWT